MNISYILVLILKIFRLETEYIKIKEIKMYSPTITTYLVEKTRL